ncbi:hypothetical protein ANO14919_104480 [Xylariales sp. No.14919]|nr:hypothetical protein ANO14919_104480 [Xylariales sp. No.14919]
MVVSTAQQARDNYLLWQRFSFPNDTRAWDAVAVPSWVGDQINTAYSMIITLAFVNFWTIVISIVLYPSLKRFKNDVSKLDPVAVTLWNKRGDLTGSILETISFKKSDWTRLWVLVTLAFSVAAYVAQTVAGIIVPPLVILNHAAPVNPQAIYVPDDTLMETQQQTARFSLEAPRFFRALGSAQADEDLRRQVNVSDAQTMGQTSDGQDIVRIDYGYQVTGTDLGLQKYFDLTLTVTGSCVTDYSWLLGPPTVVRFSNLLVAIDGYHPFLDPSKTVTRSLLDGYEPSATFLTGSNTTGALTGSNITWAAIVSSVNRTSFSQSSDPWYLTEEHVTAGTETTFRVRPGRPALSCWQDDVWSYRGRNSSVTALTNEALPGLDLPEPLWGLIIRYLSTPMIFEVGRHLAKSALASSTMTLGSIIDAASSSVQRDLERLVIASYVATTNIFTDTTLYPASSKDQLGNMAVDDSGTIPAGAGAFVIFSEEVATLSTVVLIVIPVIWAGTWLVSFVLLYWTPLRILTSLDSSALQSELADGDGDEPAHVNGDDEEAGHVGTRPPARVSENIPESKTDTNTETKAEEKKETGESIIA